MKIRVLFYKAKLWDGHWLDNGIDAWTWLVSSKNREVGHYSHVEGWNPLVSKNDGNTYFSMWHIDVSATCCRDDKTHKQIKGTCWTSTMRGKENGSVSRPAVDVIQNMDRWDYCEIDLSESDFYKMNEYVDNEVANNKGYAFRDTGKFVGLGILADSQRNICSEILNNALYFAGKIDEMGVVSPRRLAYLLVQAGYTIKPLSEG